MEALLDGYQIAEDAPSGVVTTLLVTADLYRHWSLSGEYDF